MKISGNKNDYNVELDSANDGTKMNSDNRVTGYTSQCFGILANDKHLMIMMMMVIGENIFLDIFFLRNNFLVFFSHHEHRAHVVLSLVLIPVPFIVVLLFSSFFFSCFLILHSIQIYISVYH